MPYSNIVWIKLFLDLFDEDDRFLYQLNESQQLLFIKLLYLAGRTGNQIPKTPSFIKHKINYSHEDSCLIADIERILKVFPKFRQNEKCYYFSKFDELHNRLGCTKLAPAFKEEPVPEPKTQKDRLDEKFFNEILNRYPDKSGKKEALRHFNASVKTIDDYQRIDKALDNYLKSARVKNGYAQNASTWFNNWQDWENPTPSMMGGLSSASAVKGDANKYGEIESAKSN